MRQLSIILLLLFNLSAFAQDTYMEWGNFPIEDLKMKSYELDKEANAVVLGQTVYAKYDFVEGMMIYNYHIRIKILSKAGSDQATIELPYYSHNRTERINSIKAITATLKNGKIVKTKLTKKDIFKEKVNEFVSQKKFTMPAVEVGSIIEYKYEFASESNTVLEDFYFQGEIPVKWAEVNIKVPEYLEYVALAQKTLPFHIKTSTPTTYDLGVGYKKINGTIYRWVAKDMPALIEESFVTNINNHRQRIRIQLQRSKLPNSPTNEIFSSWTDTRKRLIEHSNFGDRFTKKNGIKKVSEQCPSIANLSMDKEQRVREIYQFVQQNMKWDGGFSYMVDRSFDDLFEAHTGDVGEINLMLVSLLQNAGFEAYPVLLSTRNHGKHTPVYPILKQFNYLIVEVIIDGKSILLDAVEPTLPMGMVSYRCLNGQAWSLKGMKGTWIEITPKQALKIVQINLQLQEDGSAKGFIKSIYNGYEAINQRKKALSSNEDEYLEEKIKEDIPNIKIDSLVFKNKEKTGGKFYENIYFTIPEAAEIAGDIIYFNPLLNKGWEENPFKLKERTYPIDLGYPFYQQIIINISPPAGYEIDELPENAIINLLNKGGSFSFLSTVLRNGDTQISSKLKLQNSKYYSDEYQSVKQFFDMVIDKHSTQLVYKKVE